MKASSRYSLSYVVFLALAIPALLLSGSVGAVTALDVPVSRWCMTHGELPKLPALFLKEMMVFEMFGELPVVLLFMAGIFLLDPENHRSLFRFGLAVLAAPVITAILKHLIFRYRPRTFFSEAFVFPNETVWQSFQVVKMLELPVKETMSFPSGHSACACAFALAMFRFYPRGGILYFPIAFGVMCQRVISGAHYPSDTLAGAAIGFLAGSLILFPPRFSRRSVETVVDSSEMRDEIPVVPETPLPASTSSEPALSEPPLPGKSTPARKTVQKQGHHRSHFLDAGD